MRQIRAAGAYLEDPEVNDYLMALGHRLVAAIPEGRQEFQFFAVGDSTVNAFALPGGYIGVNTGLILLTQSESELAAVLAHEITHVTQRHIARGAAKEKNAILAKVSAQGMQSLTNAEKRALGQATERQRQADLAREKRAR